MASLSSERWLPIPEHEGYEASSLGRIRSIDRVITDSRGVSRSLRGKVLAQREINSGYLASVLGRATGNRTVHRLVCAAFHGPPAEGEVVRHLNNDRHDNRPENLAWGTSSENMIDWRNSGTWRNQNLHVTHCKHGHEFAGENLIIRPNGNRACRECSRARTRAYQDANRELVRERWRNYARRKRASTQLSPTVRGEGGFGSSGVK